MSFHLNLPLLVQNELWEARCFISQGSAAPDYMFFAKFSHLTEIRWHCETFSFQDTNRVWIELEVLRDLYTCNRSASKMVCLTLPDMPLTSEPLPLWAKVSYKWPDDAMEIFKRLNDRPKILAM